MNIKIEICFETDGDFCLLGNTKDKNILELKENNFVCFEIKEDDIVLPKCWTDKTAFMKMKAKEFLNNVFCDISFSRIPIAKYIADKFEVVIDEINCGEEYILEEFYGNYEGSYIKIEIEIVPEQIIPAHETVTVGGV